LRAFLSLGLMADEDAPEPERDSAAAAAANGAPGSAEMTLCRGDGGGCGPGSGKPDTISALTPYPRYLDPAPGPGRAPGSGAEGPEGDPDAAAWQELAQNAGSLHGAPGGAALRRVMGWSPLHVAAMEGGPALLRRLVGERGCALRARSASSWTALHCAAAHNQARPCPSPYPDPWGA